MMKKYIQTAFLFFLFLLPFQTVYLLREPFIEGVKWQYGTIGIYISDLLLVSIFISFIVQKFFQKYTNKDWENIVLNFVPSPAHPVSIILYQSSLILLVTWSFFSIFWAGETWLALSTSFVLLLATGLFFFVRALPREYIKRIVFVLLFSGVVQSGIGIAQFLYQQSIDSSLFGMSSHVAYEAGSSVLKIDSGRFLRAYGTFSHPNILGLYLGVILVLGASYYVFLSTFEKTFRKARERMFLLASLLVIFLGLILTFSRSAWLGVLFGIMVISVGIFLQKEKGVRMRFLKILFVFLLASLVFGTLLSQQIFPRFDAITIDREGSITERVQSLHDAGIIIGEGNILLGTGIGNFTAQMIHFQPERPVWSIQPAHNVFVLILAELGVVGCMLFLFFLFSVVMYIFTSLKDIDHTSLFFTCALMTIIPSLFLDHFLWSSHFGLLFLFFLFGMVSRR